MFKIITRSSLALLVAISFIYIAGCSGSAVKKPVDTECTDPAGCLPKGDTNADILGITPPEGPVRTKVKISMMNADKDADTVFFGDTQVEKTANDAEDAYEFEVPQVAAGSYNIHIENAGIKSSEVAFKVTEAETPGTPPDLPDDPPKAPDSAKIVKHDLTACLYNVECPQLLRASGGDSYIWEITGLPPGLQKQAGDRDSEVKIVGKPAKLGPFTVKVILSATKDGAAIGGDEKEQELTVSQSIAIDLFQTQTGADAIPIEKGGTTKIYFKIPFADKQTINIPTNVNQYMIKIPFGEKLELRATGIAPEAVYSWKIETGKVECDNDQPCDITSGDLSITGSGKTAQVQANSNFIGKQFHALKITVADQFENNETIVIDNIKFLKDPCSEFSVAPDPTKGSSEEDFELGEKLSLEKVSTFTVKGGKGPFAWWVTKDPENNNDAKDVPHHLPLGTMCDKDYQDGGAGLCTTTSRMGAEAKLEEKPAGSDSRQRKIKGSAQIAEYSYLNDFPGKYNSMYKVTVMDGGCNKEATATYEIKYKISDKIEFDGGMDTSRFVSELTLGAESTDGDSKIDMAFQNDNEKFTADEEFVAKWLKKIDDLDAIGDEGSCSFGTRCRVHRKKKIITSDESGTGGIDIRQMKWAHVRMFDPGDDAMYLAIHNYSIEAPGWCGIVNKLIDRGGNMLYDDSYWLTCEDDSKCREHFAIEWRTGPKNAPCKQPFRYLTDKEYIQLCNHQYITELEQISRQYTVEVPDMRAARATAALTECILEAGLRDNNGQ